MNFSLFLGKMHPLLVHFPIAILFFAAATTLFLNSKNENSVQQTLPKIWLAGGLAAVVACLSGWQLATEHAAENALQVHRNGGVGTAAVAILMFVFSKKWQQQVIFQKIWAVAVLFLTCFTWHFGTTLTHGEGYFFKKNVAFVEIQPTEKGMFPSLDLPEKLEVPAAKNEDIQAVEKTGLLVLPVSMGSPWLSVSAVNTPDFSDSLAGILTKIAPQMVWLRLSGCQNVGDSAAQFIGQLTHLTRLQLDGTNITDKGLTQISALSFLKKINLANTRVTAQGVQVLSKLPHLERLYLNNTKIEAEEWSNLQSIFLKTKLDTGGYFLPTIASDSLK